MPRASAPHWCYCCTALLRWEAERTVSDRQLQCQFEWVCTLDKLLYCRANRQSSPGAHLQPESSSSTTTLCPLSHCPIGAGKVSIWVHAIEPIAQTLWLNGNAAIARWKLEKRCAKKRDKVGYWWRRFSSLKKAFHLISSFRRAQKRKSALVVCRY